MAGQSSKNNSTRSGGHVRTRVENALHGALYSMHAARSPRNAHVRRAVLFLLDVIQVFALTGHASFGYPRALPATPSVAATVIAVAPTTTVLVLFSLAALFVVLVGINLAFVAISFHRNRFVVTWPIRTLEMGVTFALTVALVPLTEILLVPAQCKDGFWRLWPRRACWTGIETMVPLSGFMLALAFAPFALLMALVYFEMRPSGSHLGARSTGRVQLVWVAFKLALSVVNSLDIAPPWAFALLLVLGSGATFWIHWRLLPFFSRKLCVRVGAVYGALFGASVGSLIAVGRLAVVSKAQADERPVWPLAVAVALLVAGGVGAVLAIRWRIRALTRLALQIQAESGAILALLADASRSAVHLSRALQTADGPDTASAAHDTATSAPLLAGLVLRTPQAAASIMPDETSVELLVRLSCKYRRDLILERNRDADQTATAGSAGTQLLLATSAVAKQMALMTAFDTGAESIFNVGRALFPRSSLVALHQAAYLFDLRPMQPALALASIEASRVLPSALDSRFSLYVFEKSILRTVQAHSLGEEQQLDVVSMVSFQTDIRAVERHHDRALALLFTFWQLLSERRPPTLARFLTVTTALTIAERRATKSYEALIRRFPNSRELLLSYAQFLESVVHDYESADRHFALADLATTIAERDDNHHEVCPDVLSDDEPSPFGMPLLDPAFDAMAAAAATVGSALVGAPVAGSKSALSKVTSGNASPMLVNSFVRSSDDETVLGASLASSLTRPVHVLPRMRSRDSSPARVSPSGPRSRESVTGEHESTGHESSSQVRNAPRTTNQARGAQRGSLSAVLDVSLGRLGSGVASAGTAGARVNTGANAFRSSPAPVGRATSKRGSADLSTVLREPTPGQRRPSNKQPLTPIMRKAPSASLAQINASESSHLSDSLRDDEPPARVRPHAHSRSRSLSHSRSRSLSRSRSRSRSRSHMPARVRSGSKPRLARSASKPRVNARGRHSHRMTRLGNESSSTTASIGSGSQGSSSRGSNSDRGSSRASSFSAVHTRARQTLVSTSSFSMTWIVYALRVATLLLLVMYVASFVTLELVEVHWSSSLMFVDASTKRSALIQGALSNKRAMELASQLGNATAFEVARAELEHETHDLEALVAFLYEHTHRGDITTDEIDRSWEQRTVALQFVVDASTKPVTMGTRLVDLWQALQFFIATCRAVSQYTYDDFASRDMSLDPSLVALGVNARGDLERAVEAVDPLMERQLVNKLNAFVRTSSILLAAGVVLVIAIGVMLLPAVLVLRREQRSTQKLFQTIPRRFMLRIVRQLEAVGVARARNAETLDDDADSSLEQMLDEGADTAVDSWQTRRREQDRALRTGGDVGSSAKRKKTVVSQRSRVADASGVSASDRAEGRRDDDDGDDGVGSGGGGGGGVGGGGGSGGGGSGSSGGGGGGGSGNKSNAGMAGVAGTGTGARSRSSKVRTPSALQATGLSPSSSTVAPAQKLSTAARGNGEKRRRLNMSSGKPIGEPSGGGDSGGGSGAWRLSSTSSDALCSEQQEPTDDGTGSEHTVDSHTGSATHEPDDNTLVRTAGGEASPGLLLQSMHVGRDLSSETSQFVRSLLRIVLSVGIVLALMVAVYVMSSLFSSLVQSSPREIYVAAFRRTLVAKLHILAEDVQLHAVLSLGELSRPDQVTLEPLGALLAELNTTTATLVDMNHALVYGNGYLRGISGRTAEIDEVSFGSGVEAQIASMVRAMDVIGALADELCVETESLNVTAGRGATRSTAGAQTTRVCALRSCVNASCADSAHALVDTAAGVGKLVRTQLLPGIETVVNLLLKLYRTTVSNSFVLTISCLFAAQVTTLVLGYFFIFVPLTRRVGDELTRLRTLILMVPPVLVRSLPQVSQYILTTRILPLYEVERMLTPQRLMRMAVLEVDAESGLITGWDGDVANFFGAYDPVQQLLGKPLFNVLPRFSPSNLHDRLLRHMSQPPARAVVSSLVHGVADFECAVWSTFVFEHPTDTFDWYINANEDEPRRLGRCLQFCRRSRRVAPDGDRVDLLDDSDLKPDYASALPMIGSSLIGASPRILRPFMGRVSDSRFRLSFYVRNVNDAPKQDELSNSTDALEMPVAQARVGFVEPNVRR